MELAHPLSVELFLGVNTSALPEGALRQNGEDMRLVFPGPSRGMRLETGYAPSDGWPAGVVQSEEIVIPVTQVPEVGLVVSPAFGPLPQPAVADRFNRLTAHLLPKPALEQANGRGEVGPSIFSVIERQPSDTASNTSQQKQ